MSLPEITLIEKPDHPKPADKRKAANWARALLARNDWVILDTETTGLGDTAEVIQIGIISPDNEILLDTYVKPLFRKRIPSEATAIHGITMNMLQNAPSMPELMPRLKAMLKDKVIVCYNAEYDARLLSQTVRKNGDGGARFHMRFECAMVQYAIYAGDWWQWKHDYKWQKLPGGDHSSLGDCRATLALIRKMANFAGISGTNNAEENQPSRIYSASTPIISPKSAQPSNPFGWLLKLFVFLAATFFVLALIGSAVNNSHSPETSSSDSKNGVATKPSEASTEHASIGKEKAWIPTYLPNDIKSTLVTMPTAGDSIDYTVYLSGPANSLKQIFGNHSGWVSFTLFNHNMSVITHTKIAANDFLEDSNGNLVAKSQFSCTSHDYNRASKWKLQLFGIDPAPLRAIEGANNASTTAQGDVGASMPPVAPDRTLHSSSMAGPTSTNSSDRAGNHNNSSTGSDSPSPDFMEETTGRGFVDRISRCEIDIFSRPQLGLSLPQRLDRLENKVFKHTFSDRPIADRIDFLERTLGY